LVQPARWGGGLVAVGEETCMVSDSPILTEDGCKL
jgi:hypothetical protein